MSPLYSNSRLLKQFCTTSPSYSHVWFLVFNIHNRFQTNLLFSTEFLAFICTVCTLFLDLNSARFLDIIATNNQQVENLLDEVCELTQKRYIFSEILSKLTPLFEYFKLLENSHYPFTKHLICTFLFFKPFFSNAQQLYEFLQLLISILRFSDTTYLN